MRLQDSEWLAQAQKLPQGTSRRTKHTCGNGSPSLVLYHNNDSWSAYCWRCKRSASVDKTHVLLRAEPPPPVRSVPTDLALVRSSAYELAIAEFVAAKGMDLLYLPADLWYSAKAKRLVLCDSGLLLGRDLTGRSAAKWLNYSDGGYLGEVQPGGTVVVVEDAFSYYKVKYALNRCEATACCAVVCALGTKDNSSLVLAISATRRCIVMFDGDKAGHVGADQWARRFAPFGVSVVAHCAPDGLDPKDMRLQDIVDHIRSVL